jgi:hypothetical protein
VQCWFIYIVHRFCLTPIKDCSIKGLRAELLGFAGSFYCRIHMTTNTLGYIQPSLRTAILQLYYPETNCPGKSGTGRRKSSARTISSLVRVGNRPPSFVSQQLFLKLENACHMGWVVGVQLGRNCLVVPGLDPTSADFHCVETIFCHISRVIRILPPLLRWPPVPSPSLWKRGKAKAPCPPSEGKSNPCASIMDWTDSRFVDTTISLWRLRGLILRPTVPEPHPILSLKLASCFRCSALALLHPLHSFGRFSLVIFSVRLDKALLFGASLPFRFFLLFVSMQD